MRLPVGSGSDAWEVLADGTRRQLVAMLLDGEASASQLATRVAISRQGVLKHLVILERVGLVHRRVAGREVRFRVDDHNLARAARDMGAAAREWDDRLNVIRQIAEGIQREQ